MYRFSYVPGVSGRAVEVTKDLFYQIIRDPKVAQLCEQIKSLTPACKAGPPLSSGRGE